MPIRKASKCVAILKAPSFVLTWSARGQKRPVEETFSEDEHLSEASSSTSVVVSRSARAREKQPAAAPVKKRMYFVPRSSHASLIHFPAKRAETRKCPVCDEPIPLRLLGKHADLESERLDEIMRCIGSTEVLEEAEPEDGCVLCAHIRALCSQSCAACQVGSYATVRIEGAAALEARVSYRCRGVAGRDYESRADAQAT